MLADCSILVGALLVGVVAAAVGVVAVVMLVVVVVSVDSPPPSVGVGLIWLVGC